MKLKEMRFQGFRQFDDLRLELVYPADHERAGEPLDRVCFIGTNGTGKSTILRCLSTLLSTPSGSQFIVEAGGLAWNLHFNTDNLFVRIDRDSIRNAIAKEPFEAWLPNASSETTWSPNEETEQRRISELCSSGSLVIWAPAESSKDEGVSIDDVPSATLDSALQLLQSFPSNHVVSNNTIREFWRILIFLIKKRASDKDEFFALAENKKRMLEEVEADFDKRHPDILVELAQFWDAILGKAGLRFDYASASRPVQLTDNLRAYILTSTKNQRIPYSALSTGIRTALFRLGHIFSIYFHLDVEDSFLLIDEPEGSLHPELQYDIIDLYSRIAQGAQLFVATQSEIVAAQFAPYERFVLEFDENFAVRCRRGTAPEGDDPNDLLLKDFGVGSLYGRKGQEAWQRYLELRMQIGQTRDETEKLKLLEERSKLGRDYDFPAK